MGLTSFHKSMILKYQGSPAMLLVAGGTSFISFVIGVVYIYKPWRARQRRNQAREYAEYLTSLESKHIES